MNHYETVFTITPVLSENQVKETVNKFEQLIKNNKGNIIHKENWGLKKMAYPIKKKNMGFYQLLQFDAPGEMIKMLETNFKHDERVIRYITIKLDRFAYAYAEKRKNKLETQKETK